MNIQQNKTAAENTCRCGFCFIIFDLHPTVGPPFAHAPARKRRLANR